jgi:hypothetical protein
MTTPKDDIDYSALTPGIRRTVALVRSWGFDTTDSGDGVTNVQAGMEGAMTVPNVYMAVLPSCLIAETDRLLRELFNVGVDMDAQGPDNAPCIQAMYDPCSNSAGILLMGVDDAQLERVLGPATSNDGA